MTNVQISIWFRWEPKSQCLSGIPVFQIFLNDMLYKIQRFGYIIHAIKFQASKVGKMAVQGPLNRRGSAAGQINIKQPALSGEMPYFPDDRNTIGLNNKLYPYK